MRHALRAFAAALTFLTRIPTTALGAHDLSDLSRSAPYFPVVGLIVGGAAALVFTIGARVWSPVLAIIVTIAATVLLTGAFHEDALADSFDGFGGGWTVDQVLNIMKDSRVGSYALVGVALVLAAKVAALCDIAQSSEGAAHVARSLIAAHVLGRWSSVPLIRYYPYVRPASSIERPGVGRPFVDSVTVTHLVIATAIAALVTVVALGWSSIGVGLVALVITVLAGRYFKGRIGGITGDALGAANQLVELGVYLVLAARLRS